jgi:nucleosome binding factor SPN SPT16 subunit
MFKCSKITNNLFLVLLKPFLTEVQNVNSLVLLTKSLCTKFVLPGKRMDKVQTKVLEYLRTKPCLGYEFETEALGTSFSCLAEKEE